MQFPLREGVGTGSGEHVWVRAPVGMEVFLYRVPTTQETAKCFHIVHLIFHHCVMIVFFLHVSVAIRGYCCPATAMARSRSRVYAKPCS